MIDGNTSDRQEEYANPPQIAVLGASGFIGGYLVLNLIHLGCRLNLLSHRKNPDFISPGGQIKTFQGSIESEDEMAACFEGCDLVFHLVGIIAETRKKTFQNTVADGTARVVSAARKAGVGKIIYLSALGTSENADSDYYRTKWEAERHVSGSGLDYTIFRPSIVYGIGDQFINKIAGMVKYLPLIPVIGDGLYKMQPVYVEELCAVMSMAAFNDFTAGKIYEIGGPGQLTYIEILDIIKRVLDSRKAVVHIPLSLARVSAYLMELFLKPAPLTRDQLKMMAAGSVCDQTVAEKEFGVKFSDLERQLNKYMRE